MHSTRMVSEQHQLSHVVLTGTVPSDACPTRPDAYRGNYRCYVTPVLHIYQTAPECKPEYVKGPKYRDRR